MSFSVLAEWCVASGLRCSGSSFSRKIKLSISAVVRFRSTEVDRRGRSGFDLNRLSHRAVAFVPGLDLVCARRYVGDFERAGGVGYGEVGMTDDPTYAVIQLCTSHLICSISSSLHFELLHHAGLRLAHVEGIALGRQAVNVVHQLVAVVNLQRLADSSANDPRQVRAALLIEFHRLGWHWRLWKRSFELDEHVGEAAVQQRPGRFPERRACRR